MVLGEVVEEKATDISRREVKLRGQQIRRDAKKAADAEVLPDAPETTEMACPYCVEVWDGYDCSEPTLIYEDNQACISISEGETDKKRTKHIAKHYHFVREAMKKGLILLIYCKTALRKWLTSSPSSSSQSTLSAFVGFSWDMKTGMIWYSA